MLVREALDFIVNVAWWKADTMTTGAREEYNARERRFRLALADQEGADPQENFRNETLWPSSERTFEDLKQFIGTAEETLRRSPNPGPPQSRYPKTGRSFLPPRT